MGVRGGMLSDCALFMGAALFFMASGGAYASGGSAANEGTLVDPEGADRVDALQMTLLQTQTVEELQVELGGLEDDLPQHFRKHMNVSSAALDAFETFVEFLQANHRDYFHGKDVPEFERRIERFATTLALIEERNEWEKNNNKHPRRAVHGINQYSDWHQSEFLALLGHKKRAEKGVVGQVQSAGAGAGGEGQNAQLVQRSRYAATSSGTDVYSNCKELFDENGCHAQLGGGHTMHEGCPEECPEDGPVDLYNNCGDMAQQVGCGATVGSGMTMTQACPYTCSGYSTTTTTTLPTPSSPPCTKAYTDLIDIRNQGSCGDCWTFSTVETLRAAYRQQTGSDPGKLSTQFLVDCMERKSCSDGVNGCCGGNVFEALKWIQQQGGIPTQESYGDYFSSLLQAEGPVSESGKGITYSGNNPTTSFPCKSGIESSVTLSSAPVLLKSEGGMADHICNTGTIAVSVDASSWQTYTGGVMTATSCGTQTDHALHLIGLNASDNAWILQNSWGTNWGVAPDGSTPPKDKYNNCPELVASYSCEGTDTHGQSFQDVCKASCSSSVASAGYIYLAFGDNTCGLASEPVIVPAAVAAD